MYKLYYYPGNANLAPHIVLEELGLEYELHYLDRNLAAHKQADYLRLNPHGRIPVLIDGELILYESAAICLHLVDSHPGCDLIPAVGTTARAQVYKWLMYLTNTLQTELLVYFYPERLCDAQSTALEIKEHAQQRVSGMLDIIEAELLKRGAYLAAHNYTLVDAYLLMICRWTREMQQPARMRPTLKSLLDKVLQREAVQRALSSEGVQAPFI